MKIFIDSADIEEIKEAFSWGIVDGVTTNPSLIKKAMAGRKEEMVGYIEGLLKAVNNCPVSLEVDGELEGKIREEQMVREAMNLYGRFKRINEKVNIKIPVNPAMRPEEDNQFEGLRAIKRLSKGGVPINATLIMTPEQALLAAKAGASYVSPFAGRIDDYIRKQSGMKDSEIGEYRGRYFPAKGMEGEGEMISDKGIVSGVDLIEKSVRILRNYNFKTEVIAASLRNARQVREVALVGTDIATIPFKVLKEMVGHEKTYEGVKKFKEDIVPEYKEMLKDGTKGYQV